MQHLIGFCVHGASFWKFIRKHQASRCTHSECRVNVADFSLFERRSASLIDFTFCGFVCSCQNYGTIYMQNKFFCTDLSCFDAASMLLHIVRAPSLWLLRPCTSEWLHHFPVIRSQHQHYTTTLMFNELVSN